MIKVITYGTFDMFHEGHLRLLERARKLGDYLVVGVTTDYYDDSRGKLNVNDNLMTRIENVKATGLADEIIIEEYEGQKINDIQQNDIDIFALGSDWLGKFDYINDYCKVVYLERTKGISSTQLRAENLGIIRLGIVGNGRIAKRFVDESKFVSGLNIEGVFGRTEESLKAFTESNDLGFYEIDYAAFLDRIDAVYIASPHETHYAYAKLALENNKHVLCEKPLVLKGAEAEELYELASDKGLILLEAIKTAYSPGFLRLVNLARSGVVGEIKHVDATFTKLSSGNLRELKAASAGGSMTELASYPLLAIIKLLGQNIIDKSFTSFIDETEQIDLFTHMTLYYKGALATAKVGLGVKSEGSLIISGTKGYIYVPSPWWKTEYFEVRYENFSENKKHFYKFEGDGLRYELADFLSMINKKVQRSYKLSPQESILINKVIEDFRKKENVRLIK